MNIKIIKNGYKVGTVGWLAKGLEDGTLTLKEGTMRNGNHHALWLKGPDDLSQFLAAHNQYGAQATDNVPGWDKYMPEIEPLDGIFTPACRAALISISEQWCADCNDDRDNDQEHQFTISRVFAV